MRRQSRLIDTWKVCSGQEANALGADGAFCTSTFLMAIMQTDALQTSQGR